MPQRRCAWARMASSRCRSAPATRAKPSAGKLRPLDHLETVWKALREGPQRLTQREVSALAGEAYRDVKAKWEDDPGPGNVWRGVGGAAALWDDAATRPTIYAHLAGL